MTKLTFSDAFRQYGASLSNPQWAFSAEAANGDIVVSLWGHKVKKDPNTGTYLYRDKVSRSGKNVPGHNLFQKHLQAAFEQGLSLRIVIATASDETHVDAGLDGSKVGKSFHAWDSVMGKVVEFDGDAYLIEFHRSA